VYHFSIHPHTIHLTQQQLFAKNTMSATNGVTNSTRKRLREDCHEVVVSVSSPGCWNPPPLPSTSLSTTTDTSGQRLLGLLRALDKYDKDHERNDDDNKDKYEQSLSYLSTLSEALNLFQQLSDQVSRRGLLQGNTSLAERVLLLAASSTSDSGIGGGRSSHKRKHKNGRNNNNNSTSKNNHELTLMDGVPTVLDEATKGTNATTSTLDVQLVLVAVSRVLEVSGGGGGGGGGTSSSQSLAAPNDDCDRRWIVAAAAANLVTASSRYIHSMTGQVSETDTCFLAEYELVARPGKSLLSGLHQHVTVLLNHHHQLNQSVSNCDQEEVEYAMVACLRAAASLVTLFGTRLSRSTTILTNWYGTASTVLTANHCSAHHHPATAAATALLVVLVGTSSTAATTMAAGSLATLMDSSSRLGSAAAAWNRAVGQAVLAMGAAMRRVAPVVTAATKELLVAWPSSQSSDDATDWVGTMSEKFLSQIQDSTSESTKVDLFLQLLDRLVGYLVALFSHSAALANSTGAAISVDAILSLIDTMLAFSMACEAKYHGTKKRLRHEAIENGCLSPMALVSHVALPVRRHGHVLMDALLSLLSSGGNLLPYARRVWKLAADALWTSSSAASRGVLDPTTSLHGKWPRWLHTSVAARVAAVESLHRTVQTLGIVPAQTLNAIGTRFNTGPRNRNHHAVERAITLICGTLMEAWSSGRETVSFDWGSLSERVSLCVACASCLAAALSCGGEYLSRTVRELVDSVATASLEAVRHGHVLVTSGGGGSVQASILNLGTAIVVTPWPDGAASASSLVVQTVARASLQSGHADVVAAATNALQVCAALSCPRVPALHVVTRAQSDASVQPGTPSIVTASGMAAQLDVCRAEIERVKAAAAATAQEQALSASSKRNQSSKAAKTNDAAVQSQATRAASDHEILPEQENTTLSPTHLPNPDYNLTVPTNATTGTGISGQGDVFYEIVRGKVADHPPDVPMPDAQANVDDDFDFPPIVDCPPDEDDV
jgi:hypothetical protein